MKLVILILLIAITAHADELQREPYWYEIESNLEKAYVLTLMGADEPYFFEMPDDYVSREDCIAYAIKLFRISKDRRYTGFICERGRAAK